MISIIIPVYNGAETIEQCLNSIFVQSYSDYEVIVVDDGSTDQTNEVLQKFATKIKIIHQTNQGAPAARNNGWRTSIGQYLLFCDADIILKPQALTTMIAGLDNHPEVAYTYSSFVFNGKLFKLWPFDGARLQQMPYIHTTTLIRREAFGGFDESLRKFQDWDLWLTLLANGHTGHWIDQVLFEVRGQGTMSNWLPSWAYHLAPWLPAVKKYNQARQIIYRKHNLI